MNTEQQRLQDAAWKKWGPYLTNRQWATVREDYSDDASTWYYISYEAARSRAYRWGEDAIGGICDDEQLLCFGLSLWNKKDPFIKERLFGLTNREGNHGEDVKELYYYLDNTPTHSYMKMLYKYPMEEFPYQHLREENRKRNRDEPEYEIQDTGIFDDNKYFDVVLEYAKKDIDDILIKITIHNKSTEKASLNVIPTLWFRNTWAWGDDPYIPALSAIGKNHIKMTHRKLGTRVMYSQPPIAPVFCENETNVTLHYNKKKKGHYKDGINDFVVHGDQKAVSKRRGTKAGFNYDLTIEAGSSSTIKLRLGSESILEPFKDFDQTFDQRKNEADEFYAEIQSEMKCADARNVQRQALAGMLWNKQFYYYDVDVWLNGDAGNPVSPSRRYGRNHRWMHLHNADIISMPDKWEYPWYAAWDLAFHCIPLAIVDQEFAKQQLLLLTKERYMHPNGQLPAYEWDFSDVNPPVHAWAAWKVYKLGRSSREEKGDLAFLESIFHKLLMNFTWWVNRKDTAGNNIFQGGFLGLDNIGVFDRNSTLPNGGYIEQADGTSWMAMFALNMLRISLELAKYNKVYQDMATKFFEHFLYIAGAMAHMGEGKRGLWDDQDGFFYDQVRLSETETIQLKVRSMVGLIPLFAVEVLDQSLLKENEGFRERMKWFLENRPDLANLVSKWQEANDNEKHLLSLLRKDEIKKILFRMLDETEFLSEHGIRSLSKYHKDHPFQVQIGGNNFSIQYTAGESTNAMFGGNSNWRGPVWMPLNFMIIESLRKFFFYYTDTLKVECPTNSGNYCTLQEIATEISRRLTKLFLLNDAGKRVAYTGSDLFQNDPAFRDNLMFFEFFHGDDGKGLGATQQTGWTGLVAELLRRV